MILIETMRAFGLERIEVSEHDILYGTAISAALESQLSTEYFARRTSQYRLDSRSTSAQDSMG